MADGQKYNTAKLDTIQHPDLGELSFPHEMPAEERNAIIDQQMAEHNSEASQVQRGLPSPPTSVPREMQPTERAMQQGVGGPPMYVDVPKGTKKQFEREGQEGYQKGARIGAEAVGTAAGGEIAGGIKVTGAAGMALRSAIYGATAGATDVAGQYGQKGTVDPKEAALTTAGAAVGGAAIEGLAAGVKSFIAPWLDSVPEVVALTPAQIADGVSQKGIEAYKMAQAEEGVRKSIAEGASVIRREISKSYPAISEPVDIYSTSMKAIQKGRESTTGGVTSPLGKTAGIGRQIKVLEGALKENLAQERSLATEPMQTAEMGDILQALYDKKNITFSQAQELKSAIGRTIANGKGQLDGGVYKALTSVRELLVDSMGDAAEKAGKFGEWKAAEAKSQQYFNDFYNDNAPLKNLRKLKEGMTGRTFSIAVKPENGPRVEQALRRWGLKDSADAVRKVLDNPNKKEAIKNMQDLMASPKSFAATRMAAAGEADTARVEGERKAAEYAQSKIDRAKRNRIIGAGAAGGIATGVRTAYDVITSAKRPGTQP